MSRITGGVKDLKAYWIAAITLNFVGKSNKKIYNKWHSAVDQEKEGEREG